MTVSYLIYTCMLTSSQADTPAVEATLVVAAVAEEATVADRVEATADSRAEATPAEEVRHSFSPSIRTTY